VHLLHGLLPELISLYSWSRNGIFSAELQELADLIYIA
jgi:hypothetical protein